MKIKIAVHILVVILILAVQTTILEYFRVFNVKPNLLVIYVICISLLNGYWEGAVLGFFSGLALDMLSGKLLGFYSLLGMHLGLTIGILNKRLYRENFLVAVFFTFISTIVYEWLVYFINNFGGNIDFVYPLKGIILPEALYNSVVAVIVFIFSIKINNSVDKWIKLNSKY